MYCAWPYLTEQCPRSSCHFRVGIMSILVIRLLESYKIATFDY
jgi:hypothetical protein